MKFALILFFGIFAILPACQKGTAF